MTKQDNDDHRECRECELLRAAMRESDLGLYVRELAESKAECERHRRERAGDLKRDAERINVAQQESERLRAALLRLRDHYLEDACFDTADAVADIDAALAGDPHRDFAPTSRMDSLQRESAMLTRKQVEREIADDCDEVYNKARNGPTAHPDYREGWCNALNMFEERIRSGSYRKGNE